MKYFLKCCGFQELGSVGEDGRAKRGRYLMSSLNPDVVSFFPALSVEIPNDTALLPIVPLYTKSKTYANYVYHNSKYTGTDAKHPRNEYRIYLNAEIENHQLYLASEDIVIMRKSISQTEGDQFVYYMDVIKDHSSGTYLKLTKIIEDSPIRGGYGIYEGTLDFFEKKVFEYESGDGTLGIHIDDSVTNRISKSVDENRENLFNPATFRDFVLSGYGNACAITGQVAEGFFGSGVDVVYIMPQAVGGSCLPSNGIALSRKLSLAFVRGEFTLSSQYEVLVHPESTDPELKQYHLKQIHVPPNKFFQPSKESIDYHHKHIYGTFLH